jgi:hypothetical protein
VPVYVPLVIWSELKEWNPMGQWIRKPLLYPTELLPQS